MEPKDAEFQALVDATEFELDNEEIEDAIDLLKDEGEYNWSVVIDILEQALAERRRTGS